MFERTLISYNKCGHASVVDQMYANKRTAKRLGWKPGRLRVWYDPSGNRYTVSDGYMPGAPDKRARRVY